MPQAEFLFLKIWFCWSIVDLQCCVHFICSAKWISYTYMSINSSFRFFSHINYHRILSGVPWAINKALLVICLIHSSVCMFTPSSWFIPPGHIFSHWLVLCHSSCDALSCFCLICCVFLSFLSLCDSLFHFYLPIFMFTGSFFFLFFFLKYSWITVLCSSVLYGKVIQFYIIFHILSHYHLSQDIKYISLCCTVGPCYLSILYMPACIC